jgi:hypothetical protein
VKSSLSKHVLVSIPHAGVLCPREIPLRSLSDHQEELAKNNIDWHTEFLYDFRDILGNQHVCFAYSQVYVNVNRHPGALDESVPLVMDGLPVYRPGLEPSTGQRNLLLQKYHYGFHRAISCCKKCFILDGHSTVSGLRDAGGSQVVDDIILSDWQNSSLDPPEGTRTAPEGYLESYAEELERRLSGFHLRVTKNTTYCATYGHIMATHGWDGRGRRGQRAPLLLQETNEALYMKNGVPDFLMIEELRRLFAESLSAMTARMG